MMRGLRWSRDENDREKRGSKEGPYHVTSLRSFTSR
jgi:hypothetical protein